MNERNSKTITDELERVTKWPSKRRKSKYQRLVLQYLASKLEPGATYTEKQINTLLNQYHTFNDPALLRREMVDIRLIERFRDGSAYWRTKSPD